MFSRKTAHWVAVALFTAVRLASAQSTTQYAVTFDLRGFERQRRYVSLAATQVMLVDATLGLATISESATIIGSANFLLQTSQVATSFHRDLLATLPTTRDINAAVLMAPSVHATGPNGFYSIAGSMSYENLFLVNGVTVNENLRGQPHDLYVEDAIQETTIATAGVSAEHGRFGGGVVNAPMSSIATIATSTSRGPTWRQAR